MLKCIYTTDRVHLKHCTAIKHHHCFRDNNSILYIYISSIHSILFLSQQDYVLTLTTATPFPLNSVEANSHG